MSAPKGVLFRVLKRLFLRFPGVERLCADVSSEIYYERLASTPCPSPSGTSVEMIEGDEPGDLPWCHPYCFDRCDP